MILLCALLAPFVLFSNDVTSLENRMKKIQDNQVRYENQIHQLQVLINNSNGQIRDLKSENRLLKTQLDSLKSNYIELNSTQDSDRITLNGRIDATDKIASDNKMTLSNRTTWGVVIIIALLALLGALATLANSMRKRIKSGVSSIDEVKKAQDAMKIAQDKMQEESVRLDQKLVELLDKQLAQQRPQTAQITGAEQKPDHSFALKVGDEIAKIETNLSKMDPEVKGYKQLKQALKRIKDNFNAHGYEIVELLGQDYNDGMPFEAQFVPDDTLPEGKRLITGVTRLQINYNGEMIQSAKIVVRQNI